jgi:hypothetical protein
MLGDVDWLAVGEPGSASARTQVAAKRRNLRVARPFAAILPCPANHCALYGQGRNSGRKGDGTLTAALVLLALSAATGLAVGASWFAILISSVGLAVLSAVVLQVAGFDAISGIAIIVACLTVNQLAYFLGVMLANRRKTWST